MALSGNIPVYSVGIVRVHWGSKVRRRTALQREVKFESIAILTNVKSEKIEGQIIVTYSIIYFFFTYFICFYIFFSHTVSFRPPLSLKVLTVAYDQFSDLLNVQGHLYPVCNRYSSDQSLIKSKSLLPFSMAYYIYLLN